MDISNLTIDEKIDLVRGKGNWHTNDLNGKIPSIHLSDGPHGLRAQNENAKGNNDSIVASCFPTASASACSFDRKLIADMADAIAKEAKAAGVSVVLGPGVNMKRSPVCGRNFEYFSEDPYLAGEMASSFVKSIQSNKVATSLKHFAANSQETHRMTANSIVDERALREIYLRAFEKVIKTAQPATVMASYNFLNGKPACESEWLLKKVLREEWNYKGLVMSDWGACVDAPACIEAGMDLEMPDSYGNHSFDIKEALKTGKLSIDSLNRASKSVLKLINDYPAGDDEGLKNIPQDLLDDHYRIAQRVAAESAVLLKNDGVLPLNKANRVVIIGDLADKPRIQGGGSSHINTAKLLSVTEAFKQKGVDAVFCRGYDCAAKDMDKLSATDNRLREEALSVLKSEVKNNPDIPILVFGGLTDCAEGEGYDRKTFLLPKNQSELYRSIREISENVVFVAFGGSPYDISDILYARAILNMYLGGEGLSEACVDLLLGEKNPCGRLAETWPLSIEDTPCHDCFGPRNSTIDDVFYLESLFVGYRYYDSFQKKVRFPFGYGLSYTSFEYNEDSAKVIRGDKGEYSLTLEVTNTGSRAGKETILVFVKNPNGNIIRANRELRGFAKVELGIGESQKVTIDIDDRAFEVYDVDREEYVTVSGEYSMEVSRSVGDVIFSLPISVVGKLGEKNEENFLNSNQRRDFPSYFADENSLGDKERLFVSKEFIKLYKNPISAFSDLKPGEFTAKNSLSQMAAYSGAARILLKVGKVAVRLILGVPLSDPQARMMYEGLAEGNIDTVCNQSGGLISPKMRDKIIASANRRKNNE